MPYRAPEFLHERAELGPELGADADEVEFALGGGHEVIGLALVDLLDQRVTAVKDNPLQRRVQRVIVLLQELCLYTTAVHLYVI